MVHQWSLPNYFASKTISFMTLFFLAAGNKKFQWANAAAIACDANEYPPDYWLKMVWAQGSQTRTQLLDSLFCITCSLKINAFSVLHYAMKIALNYCMLHQFEIFSTPGTIAHCSIRLRLAASCLREAAHWQLYENKAYYYLFKIFLHLW